LLVLEYEEAIELYSEALQVYPSDCDNERAVCHANRAACYVKMVSQWKDIVQAGPEPTYLEQLEFIDLYLYAMKMLSVPKQLYYSSVR